MRRSLEWVVVIAITVAAIAFVMGLVLFMASAANAQPLPAKGCFAIDGDTIQCRAEKIRIKGLDTPETYQAKCSSESDLGNRATGRLQHLLNTRSVLITRQGRDKYQRTLATVVVGKDNVATLMVVEGLARPYTGGKRAPWCAGAQARPGAY